MFKLIVILLVSQLAAVFGAAFRDGRIVGGQPTTIDNHPYQISLLYLGKQICGGSILTSKYILTAAHCTVKYPVWFLNVRAGSSYKNSGGQVVDVYSIFRHPYYNQNTQDYDMAILELKESLTVGSPINLPVREYTNETATVTGWGALSSGGSSPDVLYEVSVPIIPLTECQAIYDLWDVKLTDRMLCTDTEAGGKDACQGDSGGPLVVDDVQVGIVSWGWGCGDVRWPGVYANVFRLRKFINQITGLPIV